MLILGSHDHGSHIYISIAHGHQTQVLFVARFSAGGEFGHRTQRSGFGALTSGVRINLGIQQQHVHIATTGPHMIQTTVADVISPPIAPNNPYPLAHQGIGETGQLYCLL